MHVCKMLNATLSMPNCSSAHENGAFCRSSLRSHLPGWSRLVQNSRTRRQYGSSLCPAAFVDPHPLLAMMPHVHDHMEMGTSDTLYQLTQQSNALVSSQLTGLTPVTFLVTFGAGLLTSLSPCTLSVLPLTIGYIGGYSGADAGTEKPSVVPRATAFALGLASTLAMLGFVSTSLGRAYGSIGSGLPIAVSVVAIAMGLNLLEVLPLRLPSLDVDVRQLSAPPLLQAYLAGLTFALAASPCSTPVLATLLAYVATADNSLLGGGLLLAYTSGYVVPLLVAAAFTGSLQRLLSVRKYSAFVTPASGVLLLAGGTYGLLTRTVLT